MNVMKAKKSSVKKRKHTAQKLTVILFVCHCFFFSFLNVLLIKYRKLRLQTRSTNITLFVSGNKNGAFNF